MSWAHVQSTGNNGFAGSSTLVKAYASNVLAGSLLNCCVSMYSGGGETISGVSDSLNGSWTQIDSTRTVNTSHGNGPFSCGIFQFPNSAAGACTVTATYSSSGTQIRTLNISEYSGIATSTPLDQKDGQTQLNVTGGTDCFFSPSVTTVNNNELIWGALLWNPGSSAVAGTGFTKRDSQSDGAFTETIVEDMNLATAGAVTSKFSKSGGTDNSGVCFVATFKEPVAGGVKVPAYLLHESGRYNLRHRQPLIHEEWKRRNSIFIPKHVYDGQLLARAA